VLIAAIAAPLSDGPEASPQAWSPYATWSGLFFEVGAIAGSELNGSRVAHEGARCKLGERHLVQRGVARRLFPCEAALSGFEITRRLHGPG
jgi:hypothetical protein